MSNNNSIISQNQIDEFHKNGVIVLPNFFDLKLDIEPIQSKIYQIIGQVMKRHNIPDHRKKFTADTFDEGYQNLITQNRALGSEIYDAVKQIPAFVRLCSHPKLEKIFQILRPDSLPGIAAGGYGIRIDNPQEERFRAPWHQEYPAQLRSLDGLVFWSSLIPILPELGPVEFCLGSHKAGVIPVHTHDKKNPEKSGAYSLILQNEEILLKQYPHAAPLTSPGDLVILDWLVLHSSGRNIGRRSRWSMQLRYFNFAEVTGMKHGWKGSYASGIDFRTIHPELCVD